MGSRGVCHYNCSTYLQRSWLVHAAGLLATLLVPLGRYLRPHMAANHTWKGGVVLQRSWQHLPALTAAPATATGCLWVKGMHHHLPCTTNQLT